MAQVETHTITALVQDRPGVLARIAGMFSRRGFNISNLAVGHSETPGLSRMTFVAEGDEWVVEQVMKQLYKLIDVVQVYDITAENIVLRELALLKVRSNAESRPEIMQLVDIFRANIGLREVMRTGRIAMGRGPATTGPRKGVKPTIDQSAPDTEVVP